MPIERDSWGRWTVARQRSGLAGATAPNAIPVVVPLPVIRTGNKQGAARHRWLSIHARLCGAARLVQSLYQRTPELAIVVNTLLRFSTVVVDRSLRSVTSQFHVARSEC